MNHTQSDFATYVHGTKCAAQFSGQTHAATVYLFKDQRINRGNIAWTPAKDQYSPWQYEWNHFVESIRKDRPHNELKRGVYADLASLMGRAACHTGQTVTWDQGIRTHGTGNVASIASGASHGCHRLLGSNVVRLADFVLAHRDHAHRGDAPTAYRWIVRYGGSFPVAIDSLGYHIELAPPIPVEVLPGRVRR